MAANNNKGNFKTYEGQARLLRAMVAAHPEVKWNCKELAKHYGSDATVYSMEHRMRDIKAQAKLISSAARAGMDCHEIQVDLPKTEKEIAKMYGASTTDGIQWQFRGIKKDAEALKAAANNGGDPSSALNLGTPKGRATSIKGTPASKRVAASGTRSTGSKRQKTQKVFDDDVANDDEDDDDDNIDFDALDTPSKLRIKQEETKPIPQSLFGGKPSRAATSAAADAIKSQSVDLTSDEEVKTPPSIFGAAPSDTKSFAPAASVTASTAQPDIADDDGGPFSNEDFAAVFFQTKTANANANFFSDDMDGEI